jgi:putative ABC transport system permease protein
MPGLSEFWRRMVFFFSRTRVERELAEEMQQHLELKTQENIASGMSPKEARYAAHRQLGNMTHLEEESREARGFFSVESFLQDLRYGLRNLRKNPGFATVAIVTLALGIGANAAIFSVVYGVLLKSLPYPQASRTLRIWQKSPSNGFPQLGMTQAQLIRLREGSQTLEAIGGYIYRNLTLANATNAERISGAFVSSGVFESLGTQPVLGRSFQPGDEAPARSRVAVLSYRTWQQRFGGDNGVLGQTLKLGGNLYTIIGVMPAGFRLPEDDGGKGSVEVWCALPIDTADLNWGSYSLGPLVRMKPGVDLARVRAEIETIFARVRQERPSAAINDPGYSIEVVRMQESLVAPVRAALWVLLGAVTVVLLIVCANVASLLLARSVVRQKEMAVRSALGASRLRLARQLLTESVLLALLGGAAGLGLAAVSLKLIVRLAADQVPRLNEVTLNVPVLLFTLAISVVAALFFGLAPATQAMRQNLNNSLRDQGQGVSPGRRKHMIQGVLTVSEIGMALVLVICAGLLLRSLNRLLAINPGFDPNNVLTAQVNLPAAQYVDGTQAAGFYDQLTHRLQALPGVVSVAAIGGLPMTGSYGDTVFQIEGRAEGAGPGSAATHPATNAYGHFYYWPVTPNFLSALRIPLLQGRTIQDSDAAAAPQVMLINETMARSYWPNGDAVGKRVRLFFNDTQRGPWVEIVGVVGNIPLRQVNEDPQPEAYLPSLQSAVSASWSTPVRTIVIRTAGDPMALANSLRAEVSSLDRSVPVSFVQTMDQLLDRGVAQPRFNLLLLGVFAAVSLVLAAVGIYGILSSGVRARTREIGIRMALGAEKSAVLRLVVGQGLRLAALGIAIGLAAAIVCTRFLSGMLYQIRPLDLNTFVAVSLGLLVVAALASYVPARRAAKVDPMIALRHE